ncbi:MAG: hypothetical protein R3268_09965 [Acidiferrobacterales bacterium]|nr:hypothetical protein [Acidiferrobacterales bacterium]
MFAFLGAVALIALPIRGWQIARCGLFSELSSLNRVPRIAVVLALAILAFAVVVWGLALFAVAMVLTDNPSRRVWGVSELGMTLDLLGFLYLGFELLFLPLTRRQLRRSVPILISATAIAIVLLPFVIYRTGVHTERRFDVYDIANSLSKDMPLAEAQAVLNGKRKPFMKVAGTVTEGGAGTIQVTTSLGWGEALFLFLYFYEGRLVATHMVGEDNPNDKFSDQPADIVPTDPKLLHLFTAGVRKP